MSSNVEDQKLVVKTKIHEGMDYINKEQYSKSLPYFEEALEICNNFDKEKNDPLTAMALIGIGTANHGNGNCREALKWYNKGLAIRESVYQDEARTDTAHLYRTLGLCNYAIGKYRESLSNFYKQRDMFEELEKAGQNHNSYIAEVYGNIGTCYEKLNNHERSLENFLIAMEKRKILYEAKHYPTDLPQDMDSSYYQAIDDYANLLRNVGAAYYRLETNYRQSESFFYQALALKQSIGNNTPSEDIITIYKDLSLTYQALLDTKNSLAYKVKHLEMKLKFTKDTSQEDLPNNDELLNDLANACNKLAQYDQETLMNYAQSQLICQNFIKEHPDFIISYSKLKEYSVSFNHDNENLNNEIQLPSTIESADAEILQDGEILTAVEDNQNSFAGDENNQ